MPPLAGLDDLWLCGWTYKHAAPSGAKLRTNHLLTTSKIEAPTGKIQQSLQIEQEATEKTERADASKIDLRYCQDRLLFADSNRRLGKARGSPIHPSVSSVSSCWRLNCYGLVSLWLVLSCLSVRAQVPGPTPRI